MKVLICADGSTETNDAIKCALRAMDQKHTYTLLFVLSERGIYHSYKHIFEEDLEKIEELFEDVDSEKKAATKIFLTPLYDYMQHDNFNTEMRVRYGHPVHEILDEIKEGNYSLVMLGNKKGFLQTTLRFGSTTAGVLQQAKICVLVAKSTQI